MRQLILLTSILLFGFSPLMGQDTGHNTQQTGNSRVIVSISPYNYKVSDTPYAHPQTLTLKQAARILSSIFIEQGPGVPILNSEDRMMLAPKMVKAFKTLGKDQQLEIVKTWGLEQKDGTFHETNSIHLYLCFIDANTLYVALVYRGVKPEEMYHLLKGRFMKYMKDKNGKKLLFIVLMDKALWTTHFNDLLFEKNIDFKPEKIKEEIDSHLDSGKKQTGEKPGIEKPATLTFEQLEKELKHLNDMRDKGLLSKTEYEKARARLLNQAGIGDH